MGTVSGGVEGNLTTNVPDAATLASLPTQSLRYYDLASVDALRSAQGGSLFFYDPAGTQTVDSVTVIATKNGTGRWLSFAIFADTIALIVSNLAALAALDTTNFRSSTRVNVQTLRSAGFFTLDRSSTATPDSVRVVAAAGTGGGNWLRNLNVSRSWCYQTQWYVDPVGGNDENTGAAVGNALKTVAELARRLSLLIQGQSYTIDLLGNVPSTDRLNWQPTFVDPAPSASTTFSQRGTITIRGQQTVVRSGTLTNATQTTTTAQASATDGATVWTADIGKLLVMTGGAQVGETCWIAADLGAGTARVSSWATAAGTAVGVVPALSTYNIVNLTQWACEGTFLAPNDACILVLQDMEVVTPTGVAFWLNVGGASLRPLRVRFSTVGAISGPFSSSNSNLLRACAFTNGSTAAAPVNMQFSGSTSGTVILTAGCLVLNFAIEVLYGVQFRCAGDVLFQGTRVNVAAASSAIGLSGLAGFGGNCGFFDWENGTVDRDAAIRVVGNGYVGITGSCFGTSAAANTWGVRVQMGGTLQVINTGGASDPSLAGSLGQIRFDDPGVGAAVGTTTPPLVPGAVTPGVQPFATWAQWAAAPFNRYAVSYRNGTRLITG